MKSQRAPQPLDTYPRVWRRRSALCAYVQSAHRSPSIYGNTDFANVLWLITELVVRHYNLDGKIEGRISGALKSIDMPTILFFLGILMAVAALQEAKILTALATWLNEAIHQPYIINGIIGVLSSIVDNVPLVAACMNMYPVASEAMIQASADPSYMMAFVEDGLFCTLLTFCAGVGGSMLIIGSAAGVVAMGIEKIPFMWYMKRITWMAFLGYIAGMVMIWLETFCNTYLIVCRSHDISKNLFNNFYDLLITSGVAADSPRNA